MNSVKLIWLSPGSGSGVCSGSGLCCSGSGSGSGSDSGQGQGSGSDLVVAVGVGGLEGCLERGLAGRRQTQLGEHPVQGKGAHV